MIPVFDLDGTLLDSDDALVAPFLSLGVARERIPFGVPVAAGCDELGVSVDDYVERYDVSVAVPFDGVEALVAELDRWAICSNKHPRSGRAELARLGWRPDVALFADDFGFGPKRLGPVLDRLGIGAADVVFVGDTDHDRRCALDVGCRFAVAAWNVRAGGLDGDVVLRHPLELLDVLRRG